MPELPDEKKLRFINFYKISGYDAEILTSDRRISEFFEEVAKNRSSKLSVSWVASELFAVLNKLNLNIENSPVSSSQLGELIDEIENGTILIELQKKFLKKCASQKNR